MKNSWLAILMCSMTMLGFVHANPSNDQKPNVILIVVDTLRADYLGCYGFKSDISPNIDKLASRGLTFKRCMSQSAWTKPSVVTLLTGLYPETHQVFKRVKFEDDKWNRLMQLPRAAMTLPRILRSHGYQTFGFAANPMVSASQGFDNGYDQYFCDLVPAPVLQEKVIQWMTGNVSTAAVTSSPFFLYIHYIDVHSPYRAELKDLEFLSANHDFGPDRALNVHETKSRNVSMDVNLQKALGKKYPNYLNSWRLAYASSIRSFDRNFGLFMDQMERLGYLKNSIVVFTSDHGEELAEHGHWEHGDTAYSDQIHVPLLVMLPKGEGLVEDIQEPVGLVDIMPTLLDFTDIDRSSYPLQGRSFLSSLMGDGLRGFNHVFSAASSDKNRQNDPAAMVSKGLKLIWNYPDGNVSLYDTVLDPYETHDLSEEKPAVTDKMLKLLRKHKKNVTSKEAFPVKEPERTLSQDEKDKLKSLGY